MSDNKTMRNRLNKIFENIKQQPEGSEQNSEPARKERRKATAEITSSGETVHQTRIPVQTGPLTMPSEPGITITQTQTEGESTLAVPFQMSSEWNLFEIKDEPTRKWKEDEQNLVRQVVDQLTLALQNAQLFQQTERQNKDLEILNAMGRELATHIRVEQVVQSVYNFTSQLMDTNSFLFALYNSDLEEISYPLFITNKENTKLAPRRLGNGLSDYVMRNRKPLLFNGDVAGQAQALGIEFMVLGEPAQSWLGVPLILGDRTLGALVVQSITTPNLYGDREQDLLAAVANQTAIALQNAQLFQQTEQQNMELAVLNEMGRELASMLNAEDIASTVYKYTGRLMDVTDFFVTVYHSETDEMSFPLAYFNGKKAKQEKVAVGNGLTARVLHGKMPLYIPDNLLERVRALDLEMINISDEKIAQCWLGVPLIQGQNTLGAIVLQSTTNANVYSEHQRDLLVAIASQTSIAVQNAKLFDETQRRASELAGLNEIMRAVSSEIDLEKVMEAAYGKLKNLVKSDVFIMAMLDETSSTVRYPVVIDQEIHYQVAPHPLKDNSQIGLVIKNRKPLNILKTQEEMISEPKPAIGNGEKATASRLYMPLLQGTKPIGALSVQSYELNAYTENDMRLMENVANQLAVAIQNAVLFRQAQERAEEQALLNRIVGAVSGSLDIQQNLQTISNEILEFFHVGHVSISTLAPDKKSLILTADAPLDENSPLGSRAPLKGSVNERVMSMREYMLLENATKHPLLKASWDVLKQRGTQEQLTLPILAGDDAVGTISLDITDAKQKLTENDIRLIETIVIQTATAIQNSQLYQNIQVSETRFRDVALASADWVWELDPAGHYTYCSDKVLDVLGYSPEEVIGKSPADLMPAWEAERVQPTITQMLTNRERMIDFENRNITKDGREVIITSSGVPMMNEEGDLIGYRGVNKDVTAQRRNQAVDNVLSEITEASVINPTLERLFPAIHESIKKILPAINLYFALYDRQKNVVSYPYKVDEKDPTPKESHILSKSLTSYLLRTGKSLHVTPQSVQKLIESNEVASNSLTAKAWIGTPLRVKEIIGAVVIQAYDEKINLTEGHLDILNRLAPQIATVIDKVRAEETLLNNRTQLSEALTMARMGYWEYDIASQIFTISNEILQLLGTSADEMGGNDITRARFEKEIAEAGSFGMLEELFEQASHATEDEITSQTETRFKTRDNKLIWVLVRFRPEKDKNGNTVKLVGSAQDITTRKEAEEALLRQNEYLATATEVGRLITSTLDLSILFDRAVNLIRARFNYYHAAVFTVDENGMTAVLREATGEAGNQMKRRQHSLAVGSKSVIGYVTSHARTLIVNNTASDPNFRPNPLLPETRAEAAIPLKIGQRVIGALDIQAREVNAFRQDDIAILETLADQIAVALDNANSYERSQKAVEEMREIDRIKTQFLANMSHELRTPLNSIIGFSRVILKGIDGPINEQQHQDLSAIYGSGQHLLGLINDILDLSKIEAGKMELSLEEVNPLDTINGVMSTASGLVKDKPVRLEKQITTTLPSIRADAMRVRQVLINLISNASKFTDEGSITVSAVVQYNPENVREVVFSVKDTGGGISPEDQTKLFQAFSQVDSSPTRKTGGTGLGLSICRHLVEMHGGRIGLHSAVGKGSTFYFSIPTYEQPAPEPQSGQGKTILCIDDDSQIISLYERYLSQQGYNIVPVTNPLTAKDVIKSVHPYAITLDIMMPELDGWHLMQDLKNDPETRDIPIIVCSIMEDEDKGFSLGASDYLVKPIAEEDLLSAINRINGDGSIKEVVVVDDSEDDLRLIEKILSEKSLYRVTLAQGGENGWQTISTSHPQAIILDLFMPDIDGFEILERLKASKELRDIPVIVISGMDLSAEQQKKLNNLGQRLVQKGNLSESELLGSLEKTLKRISAQRRQGNR